MDYLKEYERLFESTDTEIDQTLYSYASTGKVKVWRVTVTGNTLTLHWGSQGGKVQTKIRVYDKGVNIGKANEKTSEQLAVFEAQSLIKKQIRTGYHPTIKDLEKMVSETGRTTSSPRPMLAKKYKDHKKKVTDTVYVQPKLDGIRCIVNTKTGETFSRQGKEFPAIREHIGGEILSLGISGIDWVDGELYTHGVPLQKIASAIKKTTNLDPTLAKSIRYHVYDCITNKPYGARNSLLKKAIGNKSKIVKIVPTFHINKDEINGYHAQFMGDGYEGTMVRLDVTTGYEADKRSFTLLKMKDFLDAEFKIVGVEKAKRDETLGAFILIMDSGKKFKSTPKVSRDQKQEFWDNQDNYIGKLATVKYVNLTPDGVPFHSNVIAIRDYE